MHSLIDYILQLERHRLLIDAGQLIRCNTVATKIIILTFY